MDLSERERELLAIDGTASLASFYKLYRTDKNLSIACRMHLPNALRVLMFDEKVKFRGSHFGYHSNHEVIKFCMREYTSWFHNIDKMLEVLFTEEAGEYQGLLSAVAEGNQFMVGYLLARYHFPACMIGSAFISACASGSIALVILLYNFANGAPLSFPQPFTENLVLLSSGHMGYPLSHEYCIARALYEATTNKYFGISDYLVRVAGEKLLGFDGRKFETVFEAIRARDTKIDAHFSDEAKQIKEPKFVLLYPSRFSDDFEV